MFVAEARLLSPLFALYSSVFKFGLPIRTVSIKVERYYATQRTPPILDVQKLSGGECQLREEILTYVSDELLNTFLQDVNDRRLAGSLDPILHISGKDYLIPLLHRYCISLFEYKESREIFCARMARHFDPRSEPELVRRIRLVASRARADSAKARKRRK